jgi:hypothetical protein
MSMQLPAIQGVIDRRMLVNYRLDPMVAARVIPPPFRPKLVNGYAIGGICLIRLKHIRPSFLPIVAGMGSENAAHRFAVEWDRDGERHQGVYIPRRDTNSRLSSLADGRLFPGEHHHARFDVSETDDRLSLKLLSDDRQVQVEVIAHLTDRMPAESVFSSLDEASEFFRNGSLGYSATADGARFDGLELCCKTWSVTPLAVESAQSSFFDDPEKFPPGSAVLDCALLMRGVEHEWHAREEMCCAAPAFK